jgi:hypothetical protein
MTLSRGLSAVCLLGRNAIQLRISRRARRLRIDVSARRGVVVVVPEGTPREIVQRFVHARRGWIRQARERVAEEAGRMARPHEAVPARLELRAIEREYPVECVPGERPSASCDGDRLWVGGAGDDAAARQAISSWLKGLAKSELVPRLETLAATNGLRYERAAVRGQRTRWASCSGRGTISLNYKLLFLPPGLVEHVMLHELAHTRHLNHSPAFWDLLAELDPHWRAHHAALTRAMRWLPAWVEMD